MQVQLLWANNPQENTNSSKPIQGPKLDSKVLAIEPNRLLRNLAGSAIEVAQIWMPLNN
jgi:hypothetical protein